MNILYILKHDPWGIGGGCYASRCYFELFTQIFENSNFYILYCSEFSSNLLSHISKDYHTEGISPMTWTTKVLSPVTKVMDRFHRRASELIKKTNFDWCIFDHSSIAGSLVGICKKMNVKTIVLNHNCEFDYYRDSHPKWYKTIATLPVVRWNERRSYKDCDYNLFLTQEDLKQFKSTYGFSETKGIVSGCFLHKDSTISSAHAPQNVQKRIVISGTIGNVQNLDGIYHFLDEFYNIIPSDIEIVIAGKNPPEALKERVNNLSNITLVANPVDIKEIVRNCDIFLCPARLGGGQKLRIMDGLLEGLPVIAHHVSARGYSVFMKAGYFWEYSDKNSFICAVKNVLEFLEEKNDSRRQIQQMALHEFSFEEKVKMLKTSVIYGFSL